MKPRRIAALALVLTVLATPAIPHHSFAMFDQTQRITLQGRISQFQWTNPHAFIQVEVAPPDGKAGRWDVELNSPNNLKRQGWKSSSVKVGDPVTLLLFPLRDMTDHKGGLFISLTLADGTVLKEAAFNGNTGPVNVPDTGPTK